MEEVDPPKPGYIVQGIMEIMEATCCVDFDWERVGVVAAGVFGAAISHEVETGWTEAIEIQELLMKFEKGEHTDLLVYQISLKGFAVIPSFFNLACRILLIAERAYVCAQVTKIRLAREVLCEDELDDSIPEGSVGLNTYEKFNFKLGSLVPIRSNRAVKQKVKSLDARLQLGVRYYGLWKLCFVWNDPAITEKARKRAIYNVYFFTKVLIEEGPKWIEKAITFCEKEWPVKVPAMEMVLKVMNYWNKAKAKLNE